MIDNKKILNPMIRLISPGLLLFCFLGGASADTIYQWSDPWGQIQYSKTPVPGAMISDLTEMPETQETTEQQKKEAMVRKLREMKQGNAQRAQKKVIQQHFTAQASESKYHCIQLRNIMTDVQLASFSQLALFGNPFLISHYGYLHFDLSREFYSKCR